jgi:subfamily B ATP-binding cassette protein MsbA
MISRFQNNSIGYFRFYYSVLGNKLLYSIALSIAVSVLDGLGLSMLIPLLSTVSGNKEAEGNSMGALKFVTDLIEGAGFALTLGTVLGTLLILFMLKGIFKFIELKYQTIVIQYFMKKVRHELVSGLQKMTYKGFLQLDAGKLQNSFIAEVQRMSNAVRNYLTYSQAFFMMVTYVSFALLVNYQFAILFSISAGLTNVLYSHFYKKMKNASREISKKGDSFNAYMIQAITHFKYLKSTNYLIAYSKKLSDVIDKTENLNRQTGHYSAVTTGVREPMILLIVIIVIYLQINLIGGQMGSIILSLVLFYRALNFLIVIQQNWQTFLQNTGSLGNVSNISKLMRDRRESFGTDMFESLSSDIVLKDVDVQYGAHKVLRQVNVVLPHNHTIALVGESGAGKTTLANLVMGLISPDSGTVLIGDKPLTAYNLESYRARIGYISQDSVIFNDNIFNNITFWANPSHENYEGFWRVVDMTSLRDFVESLAYKEHTLLGDNGILISGGQKQRISIARELYKNAEILILDEATSALDSETELIIQENIEKLHGKYTMVVIAHRLSTIKNVDKIYLMDNGRVLVSGNFENMLQKSEKFKRMVALQGL